MAFVIIHNMIVEDERTNNGKEAFEYEHLNEPHNHMNNLRKE